MKMLVAIALVPAIAASGALAATDPPRIVPWTTIGNISVGMTRARVEYTYGRGTTVAGLYESWPVPGGSLDVVYQHGYVANLSTTSARYQTRAGLHVGSRIPLGPCHRTAGKCSYRWQGFTLENGVFWTRRIDTVGTLTGVSLRVVKGLVTEIDIARLPKR